MFYQKDFRIDNLVNGKRLAIVGPSSHLVGKNLGEYIDEYDVVCRVNDIRVDKREKDYGGRIDICFHCCNGLYLPAIKEKMIESEKLLKENNVLFVIPKIKARYDGVGNILDNFNSVNIYNLPFSWIGNNNYYFFENQIGCEPNTGIISIAMLLEYDIKELFVTGFSFYSEYLKNNDYCDCYYSYEDYCKNKLYPLTSNPFEGHNQYKQIDYFKNLLEKNEKRIKIDSYLKELLNLNHSNVKKI